VGLTTLPMFADVFTVADAPINAGRAADARDAAAQAVGQK
jgi:hypothetical protein